MKTNGKLVALLGPNEAGKSSLLQAIALLDNDEDPLPGDLSRGESPNRFLIEGRYFLSAEDCSAAGLPTPSWYKISKGMSGARHFDIEPSAPRRDRGPRDALLAALESLRSMTKFVDRLQVESLNEALDSAVKILGRDVDDLERSEVQIVADFIEGLGPRDPKRDPAFLNKLPKLLKEFQESESAPNPTIAAFSALQGRLPKILMFDERARNLASSYDLEEVAADPPVALSNLCQIAGLDLQALFAAQESGSASINTLETRANKQLKERFRSDWRQSGVSVWFRLHEGQLDVQVVNEGDEYTSIAERSDGLRQFVALQAFATGYRKGSAILLVDEADQKLHYDAQADLVQMLARQHIASKVIYTTHSAGCLPEDLGNGVRFARPEKDDENRSEIENKFWSKNVAGFSPLLFGMGASTLAFFPTRHAVMVEGPTDMLLLPTMFRQALDIDVLGFQFVPGIAYSDDNSPFHPPAIGGEGGILYLVDSDEGGVSLKDGLAKRGVNKNDIFALKNRSGSAQEVEDFIDPELILDSVNRIIQKFYPGTAVIAKSELSSKHRMAGLEQVFKSRTKNDLPKVDLAYEVLDVLSENPARSILDRERAGALRQIAKAMAERLSTNARPAPYN